MVLRRERDRAIEYYLDEDISHKVMLLARALGPDVTSAQEAARREYTDEAQLLFAAAEGRCLVSKNEKDYRRLTLDFQRRELPHAGILIVSRSLEGSQFARVAAALAHYATLYPEGMPPYMLDYLHPAPEAGR